jgi:L-fuconolactonase
MIDAHHHFWHFDSKQYAWIDESMPVLKRDFLPSDLEPVTAENGVDGVISVQARESLEENTFLLDQVRECPLIKGVVGWLPLASPTIEADLERFTSDPLFKGVREVIQGKPDAEFFDNKGFHEGIHLLTQRDLPFDLLIFEDQLESAIRFVDQHPNQRFVLDHIAKPTIHATKFPDAWAKNIRDLAKRENVVCKFSGVVTEVRDAEWNTDLLRPYFDIVLESFSPERIMFGSDWPVCLLQSSYARWIDTVRELMTSLSPAEQQQISSETAAKTYALSAGVPIKE